MTNSQWLSWFLYIEPWWLAPIRIYVTFLFCIGIIIMGLARLKVRDILFGVGIFIAEIFLIKTSHPNLDGFFQFDLVAVKLLYAVALLVIGIVIFFAARIILKRRNTTQITAEE